MTSLRFRTQSYTCRIAKWRSPPAGIWAISACARVFDVEYVCDFVRAVYDDRVVFVDGARELAPGISVHHIGGHTDGHQAVRVWTERGWLVLASDAVHFYANMTEQNPFPIVYDVGAMIEGYGHDSRVGGMPKN